MFLLESSLFFLFPLLNPPSCCPLPPFIVISPHPLAVLLLVGFRGYLSPHPLASPFLDHEEILLGVFPLLFRLIIQHLIWLTLGGGGDLINAEVTVTLGFMFSLTCFSEEVWATGGPNWGRKSFLRQSLWFRERGVFEITSTMNPFRLREKWVPQATLVVGSNGLFLPKFPFISHWTLGQIHSSDLSLECVLDIYIE